MPSFFYFKFQFSGQRPLATSCLNIVENLQFVSRYEKSCFESGSYVR